MNTATRWQHGSVVKNPPAKAGDSGEAGLIPVGWDDPLEQKMATHSSILAWKIPWTEESSGLQSMGSKGSDTTEQLSASMLLFSCSVVFHSL